MKFNRLLLTLTVALIFPAIASTGILREWENPWVIDINTEAPHATMSAYADATLAAGGGPNYRTLTPEIRQRSGGNILYVFRLP